MILGFNLFQIKLFRILFNWSIMEGSIVFTRARWVILDRANDLKTDFSLQVTGFSPQFKQILNFCNVFFEILLIFKLFIKWIIIWIMNPKYFNGIFTHLMRQSATFTPFTTPIPSYFTFWFVWSETRKMWKMLKDL